MKELNIPAPNVILHQSIWQVSSEDTKPQRMKELDIPVISAQWEYKGGHEDIHKELLCVLRLCVV